MEECFVLVGSRFYVSFFYSSSLFFSPYTLFYTVCSSSPPPPLGFGAHIITLSEQLRQGEVIA